MILISEVTHETHMPSNNKLRVSLGLVLLDNCSYEKVFLDFWRLSCEQ